MNAASLSLPRAPHRVGDDLVGFLYDGAEAFPVMLAAIGSAEREVLLEMYWFGSDETGRRFARALVERARAGVEVCVVYDAFGSIEADDAMWAEMRAAGCGVLEFNPVAPWRARFRIGTVNRRDHRKILVVDAEVAFTGGINIGDPWAPESQGGGGWRDDMAYVEGPAARELRAVFLETWGRLEGRPPKLGDGLLGRERSRRAEKVQVHSNRERGVRRAIRRAYLDRIRSARTAIDIVNSYFVPDGGVRRALARAVRRGVRVRVLLPAISDLKAVYYASRRLYPSLLRRGIEIHEWPRTVLHAKCAVVDDRWLTIGTYNLDYRSWRFNLEVNVSVEDDRAACEFRERVDRDFEASPLVDARELSFRPLAHRVLEWFFWLFHKIL